MKKILTLIILISSFVQAQVYEVMLEAKHHTEYTPEALEKQFGDIKDPEMRKWNIDQNTNPKPLEYEFFFSKTQLNSIEQEKIDNSQGIEGGMKKSAPGLPLGISYSDLLKGEHYRKVDVYGKNYTLKRPLEELDWEYTNETKEILGYKVYKATSKYMNFSVEAWFTKELGVDFMPITVRPLNGFVLEMNVFIELENVGKMNNYLKVHSVKKMDKKYKFKIPITEPGKKNDIITPEELEKLYDEANQKRNSLMNSETIDKKD